MRFGIARDLITPPFPMKVACSGTFDVDFETIHDDVYVRCLVMDDGSTKTVLFAFDLLFHDRTLNDTLADYARDRYGVAPSAVIVGATHGHTTPASRGYNMDHHSDAYEALLVDRAKTALDRAMCSMFEGKLGYDTFDADFNISRRGIVGGKFANFPAPKRKRDTEFALLTVRDLFGNLKSIVMSYGCHPVFYPAKASISGEFPARLCQLLDTRYYGCTSLYFQSAGGDVRPADTVVDGRFQSPLPFSVIDRFAQRICDAVSACVDSATGEDVALSMASTAFSIDLPMEALSLEGFQEKAKIFDHPRSSDNPNRVNVRYILNGGYDSLADALPYHCQTVKLSDDLYIAAVGGEPTSGVKDRVKEAFGDKKVLFIGYTDACAYVVDDTELQEGGYEAECHLEYCLKGPFRLGMDQRLRNGFAASLDSLK